MPKKFYSPCLYCGVLSRGSACNACLRQIEARDPRRKNRPYDHEWNKLSKLARQIQPWCSRCGSKKDLTADHILPLAAGGSNILENIQVLCRRCNSGRRD
jgi:5-methylcytosine-specific restriction endonuclease McrA